MHRKGKGQRANCCISLYIDLNATTLRVLLRQQFATTVNRYKCITLLLPLTEESNK